MVNIIIFIFILIITFIFQVTVELIPLLQPSDLEKLGIAHVGERVMLISLTKAQESKCVVFLLR